MAGFQVTTEGLIDGFTEPTGLQRADLNGKPSSEGEILIFRFWLVDHPTLRRVALPGRRLSKLTNNQMSGCRPGAVLVSLERLRVGLQLFDEVRIVKRAFPVFLLSQRYTLR
jgi:hypothetical protein